jgi:hypothetical protein
MKISDLPAPATAGGAHPGGAHPGSAPSDARYGADPHPGAAAVHARYAALLLALTLAAGVYLRAAFAWPSVRGGIGAGNVIHAHSHAGFFGWMVMGVAAALLLRVAAPGGRLNLAHTGLAHAIGLGSLAAFAGFALRGYDVLTIAISALHVGLWAILVALLWRPVGRLGRGAPMLRASLAFLLLSGAATLAPLLMMMRQVSDPWLVQFGVKLFLTPFVSGFLLLAAMGLVYEGLDRGRVRAVTLLVAVGTLPSTLLYVPGAPHPWLVLLGQGGIALVGAGLLLFAVDVLRSIRRGLATSPALLAGASAALAGVLKLLAAAGVGASFMHNRSLTVAVLHLVLLGVVTPALVLGLRPRLRAPLRVGAFAAGLAVMLLPLVVLGWPWALQRVITAGIAMGTLLAAAAVGGILATLALLSLVGVQGRCSPVSSAVSPSTATASASSTATLTRSRPVAVGVPRRGRTTRQL